MKLRHLVLILILADITMSMIFLPWAMLINAALLILAMLIGFPIFYYRLFIRKSGK